MKQNSRQNFILRGRIPRESCRSRRDLQLSLGNLGLRMRFCLEFWSMKVGFGWIRVGVGLKGRIWGRFQFEWKVKNTDFTVLFWRGSWCPLDVLWGGIKRSHWDLHVATFRSSNEHEEHLQKRPNFWPFLPSWVPTHDRTFGTQIWRQRSAFLKVFSLSV